MLRLVKLPIGAMLRCSRSWHIPFLIFSLYTRSDLEAADRETDIIRHIDAAELSREAQLIEYTVAEHYTIWNSHFNKPAEAVAEVTYKRREGKTYKLLSRSGPSLLANSVLDRLLREEGQLSRGAARAQTIITSANYNMKLIAQASVGGTPCDVIELIPKRKSPYLVKGRMWVDAADMTLMQIEGRPLASASSFEGRPQILREYKRIDGIALAVHNHASSDKFLVGQSTVDIEYRDYHVITSASEATTEARTLKR